MKKGVKAPFFAFKHTKMKEYVKIYKKTLALRTKTIYERQS